MSNFDQLEKPLNAAAQIVAKNQGRPWNVPIRVTKEHTSPGEYHVGTKECRIHPITVVEGDILQIIQKLFYLQDQFVEEERKLRRECIAYEQEAIIKKCEYLRRVLENGDYEDFIEDLFNI